MGILKINLPFLIHPPHTEDRGFPAQTTRLQSSHAKQAVTLSTRATESSKLNDSPSLHQGESRVNLPLTKANPEIPTVFFPLQG